MLREEDLENNFSGVVSLGSNAFRCEDRLPKSVIYSYFALNPHLDLLLLSDGVQDDHFALEVFSNVAMVLPGVYYLLDIPKNKYGFTSVALAPSHYHGELRGRLDEKRDELLLCVPCFKSEFSGLESADAFREMRTRLIPTMTWPRGMYPKIRLRYTNNITKAGTDEYVLTSFDVVMREVTLLAGDDQGFVELVNSKDRVLEAAFLVGEGYRIVLDRDDSKQVHVPEHEIKDRIWSFLVN